MIYSVIGRIIINAVALMICSKLIPGVYLGSASSAVVFAIVLAVVNITVGFILKLGGCLLNLLTLGLFNVLVNILVIMMSAEAVAGVHISSWISALFVSVIISIVNSMFEEL